MIKRIINQLVKSTVGSKNTADRDEWLSKIISQIPIGESILDAGAGELRYKSLCNHLNYKSQDFAQYDGVGDKKGLQKISWKTNNLDYVSDICSIPVDDCSFDNILCAEVFEHIPEPINAVQEFFRILKPGGRLILTAPFCSLTHMSPYYFYNGFSRNWYEKVLVESGFEIQVISFNGNYFEYLAQELRRIEDMEKKYTNLNLYSRIINLLSVNFILKYLEKLSKRNKGSEEFLCFGLHVVAKKA